MSLAHVTRAVIDYMKQKKMLNCMKIGIFQYTKIIINYFFVFKDTSIFWQPT